MGPVYTCHQVYALLPVAHTIFSSLRPYKMNIPEASRDRFLGYIIKSCSRNNERAIGRNFAGVVKRPGGNSRIIVCAGGPNTYGPGEEGTYGQS